MEITHLTQLIAAYLRKLGWTTQLNPNEPTIYAYPPEEDGFPKGFSIHLPIRNDWRDYSNYMQRVIVFIRINYPSENIRIRKIETLNEGLSRRYRKKDEWIKAEEKSMIYAINKFEPYFPSKTTWR